MSEQSNKKFTDLNVWQKANELKCKVFELVKKFPAEEKFNLSAQLLKAVRSIGANIAEGHGRFTYKDQIHFCIQARGSLNEVHNHLIDAVDCKYITTIEQEEYINLINETERLLNGYITFLRKQIK